MVDGGEAKTSLAEDVDEEPGPEGDTDPIREWDSAVITPLPAPLTTSLNSNLEAEEDPAPRPETDTAVVPAPPPPVTPPAEVSASVLDDENKSEEPTRGQGSSVVSAPPAHVTPPKEAPVISAEQDDLTISQDEAKMKTRGRIQRFFCWFRKTLCCCFLSEDTD